MLKNLPQPLGFFHLITNSDALHYGYWPEGKSLSLAQAQLEHTKLLMQYIPNQALNVLDVGCGLGLSAGQLHQQGCEVTAIAPSKSLIAYAKKNHPGPKYEACGFLDPHPCMQNNKYDLILFQESLQYFSELDLVFDKVKSLLSAQGVVIICDEVSYDATTKIRSAVHLKSEIEKNYNNKGFIPTHQKTMGAEVTPTCESVLLGIKQKKQQMLTLFGKQHEEHIDQLYIEWKNLQYWYKNKVFGYELWVLTCKSH